MNQIILTKQHIVMAVLQYCEEHAEEMPNLARMLDNGAMTINEFADEMIIEFIRYAYDLQMEKGSIRSYLMENDILNDSQKMAYQRIQKYAQKYRTREAERREELGDPLSERELELLRGLAMDSMEAKTSGYQINDMQFFELTQLMEVRILKSFVEHRLENSKKVSNTVFREMFEEYEKFIDTLITSANSSNEDIVFNTMAYWVLEWKVKK